MSDRGSPFDSSITGLKAHPVKSEAEEFTPLQVLKFEGLETPYAGDGSFLDPICLAPDEEPLNLTPEQQQVLDYVRAGKVDLLNS